MLDLQNTINSKQLIKNNTLLESLPLRLKKRQKHMYLLPVRVTLVVHLIGCVLVRGPLDDAGLALLALQGEGPLVGPVGPEPVGRFGRVLLPLAEAAGGGGDAEAASLQAGKDLHLEDRR